MASRGIGGVLLAVFGLAAGAAVSAYLALNPDAAGSLLYASLAICLLCIGVGVALMRRSKKHIGAPEQPHIRLTRVADATFTDTVVESDRPFIEGTDIKRFRSSRNRIGRGK